MSYDLIFRRYTEQLDDLKSIINHSQQRALQDPPDQFFVEHANFLTKSYLISLRSYLEAFLKDMAHTHVDEVKDKLNGACIPHNIVMWSISRDVKDKDLDYKDFNIPIEKSDIDDELSGNPYRTIKLFKFMGFNLSACTDFNRSKSIIANVVEKRNKIIHHNDQAGDLTFVDIIGHITTFQEYGEAIKTWISNGTN